MKKEEGSEAQKKKKRKKWRPTCTVRANVQRPMSFFAPWICLLEIWHVDNNNNNNKTEVLIHLVVCTFPVKWCFSTRQLGFNLFWNEKISLKEQRKCKFIEGVNAKTSVMGKTVSKESQFL